MNSNRTRESDVEAVIVAISENGRWTIKDIVLWIANSRHYTALSARIVRPIAHDLVSAGLVKKSKDHTGRKGRPAYLFKPLDKHDDKETCHNGK